MKMYCWSIDYFASIIGQNSLKKVDEKIWEKYVKPKLQNYEKACKSTE